MDTSGRTASDWSSWIRIATARSAANAPARSATAVRTTSNTTTRPSRRMWGPVSAEQYPAGDVRRRACEDDRKKHAERRERGDRPLLVRWSGAEHRVDGEVGEQGDQGRDDGHPHAVVATEHGLVCVA